MTEGAEPSTSALQAISNAMVRLAFQAATEQEFVTAVEEILGRKVHSFASGVDARTSVVFENFFFHPRDRDGAALSE